MSKWMDIETAPKDGTVILVYPGTWDYSASPAKWNEDQYAKKPRPFWDRSDAITVGWNRGRVPTHWIPMPEPPQREEGD